MAIGSPRYTEAMAKVKNTDPFVCNEPVEISATTSRILKRRTKTAGEGRLVSGDKLGSDSSNGFQNPLP